jgi:hypothetical protein
MFLHRMRTSCAHRDIADDALLVDHHGDIARDRGNGRCEFWREVCKPRQFLVGLAALIGQAGLLLLSADDQRWTIEQAAETKLAAGLLSSYVNIALSPVL